MKKCISFLFGFILIFLIIMNGEMQYVQAESNGITITEQQNYLFADVNQEISLSDITVAGDFGEVNLGDVTLTNDNPEVTLNNGIVKASSKGVFSLGFTHSNTTFPIYLVVKEESETAYTLYEENFDGITELPTDLTLAAGTAEIKEGTLSLVSERYSSTKVLLPDYLKTFSNYVIESDFTIKQIKENDSTRWASIMFRYTTVANYYQMAIRQAASSVNGVEFAKLINNTWNVPAKTSNTENIDANKWYHLKVEVNGHTVNEYINGEQLVTYDEATEFTSDI